MRKRLSAFYFVGFILWSGLFTSVSAYASVSFQTAHPLTPITVQINWNHQFQFAGFYAAIQQGYYQQAGLDVTVNAWQPGIHVVEEVVAGRADFAIGYSSIVADYAKGQPISLIMPSFQYSPMVLLSQQPITDLQQFSGKSVMHYGNLQIQSLINKANWVIEDKITEVSSSGDLNDFIEGKVDLYAAYSTNEPPRLDAAGIPYYTVDPKSFGIQSYGDLIFTSQSKVTQNPLQVSAFKEATIKGWEYAIRHQAEVVDYILQHYPVKKDRSALLAEAKATTVYVKAGDTPVGHIALGKLLATAEQAKEAGLISAEELATVDFEQFVFSEPLYAFTAEERAYLQQNPVIKLANDTAWAPFDFIDEQGQWQGMAAQYFALFEKQLGVKFAAEKQLSWKQVVAKAKSGELEVYPCAVATDERKRYMRFTEPYLSFPLVLATDKEVNFIDNYSQLNSQTVAVVEGYWSHEMLEKNYPQINLLLVDSIKEGLEAVISGQAMAYSGNLASINYAIKQYGLMGLHIAGQSDERFELAIGVNKDNPVLFGILEKVLKSVSEAERQAIYNQWVTLEMVNKVDRQTWIKTILIISVIILLMSAFLALLHSQKRQQQAYINRINELSNASYTNAKTRKMEWVSDSLCELTGYSKQELMDLPQDVLRHPSVDHAFYDAIWDLVMQGKSWQGELKAKRKDGSEYWIDAVVSPQISKSGVKGFWVTRTDITDKKHLEELVIKDPLTGVYNRRYFNQVLDRELNRANRTHGSFAMAIFDIDLFKEINDYYGHQRGDQVLTQIVAAIEEHTKRAGDLMFRVGGEEFVIISDFRSADKFFKYLELLRETVESLQISNPKAELKTLTISIGSVFCQTTNKTKGSALYSTMDKALYEAKHQGRNQVVMRVI